jgi:hypothetical protein
MPTLNATLSVNPTKMLPNQEGGTCQLVIQNPTTNAATVTSIQAFISGTGAIGAPVNMGVPPYGQGLLTSVPALGSVQINWGIVPFGPSNLYTGGSPGPVPSNLSHNNLADVLPAVYTVNATIQTSDGIVTLAVPQQIQVSFRPGDIPTPPLNGQLRFDSSFDSDLLGIL